MKAFLEIFLVAIISTIAAGKTSELQVSEANQEFLKNIYDILAQKDGNIFFSPISVHAVLSMLHQGAQNTTAQALGRVLKVSEAKTAAEGYSTIINRLDNITNVTLHMSNAIYAMEGKKLVAPFKSRLAENFHSDVQFVNFSQSSAAANTINAWVEKQTHNKIRDIVSPDNLNGNTQLLLINAIYFKGAWKVKFNKTLTTKEDFHESSTKTVKVDMMHIEAEFYNKHVKDLEATVLQLPYANSDLSLVILLPDKLDGIKTLEKTLANVNLSTLIDGLKKEKIDLSLPKFKVEKTIELKEVLKKLGLEILFSPKVDLSGMLINEKPYVSEVVQKAFIEVNEEGAEAAAATLAGITNHSASLNRIINIDHPFLFVLMLSSKSKKKNDKTGEVVTPAIPLFAGKIATF